MTNINSFTDKKYALSKTLRFELKPIGKTLEHIQTKGLLAQDNARATDYQEVKKIIDDYHRYFIDLAMQHVRLEKLAEFQALYFVSAEEKKTEGYKANLEKLQTELRKEIVAGFKSKQVKAIFAALDKKELITELLPAWLENEQKKNEVEKFKSFTTYFTGFHENRKNMYSDKAQSTAIAYRLIHENLPKFLDNLRIFERLKAVPELHEKCGILHGEIEEYLEIGTIDEAFGLPYFNEVLTQKGIDVYNLIIGGRTAAEGREKIKGLNEYINLYNQQQQDKSRKIPKLKPLYKQILSDRGSISFLPEKFESSQAVLDAINSYYRDNLIAYQASEANEAKNVLNEIRLLLVGLPEAQLNQVYIRNDRAITDISQALFGDFSLIKEALKYQFVQGLNLGKNGLSKTQAAALERHIKRDYFSIAEIESALWDYRTQNEALANLAEGAHSIAQYFIQNFKVKVNDRDYDFVANIDAKHSCVQGLLNTPYPDDKRLHQEKKQIDDIKEFLDALMQLLHFVKPLIVNSDSTLEKDELFYGSFLPYYEQLRLLTPLYDKVRNYATQKPFSSEKIKLNFENSTLLAGWDVNKEPDNTSILFRKGNDFFLGVMDKANNRIFRTIPNAITQNKFSKVNYKLLPGASKMLPKVFFSRSNIAFYNPSAEILNIRNHGSHTKNGQPQSGFDKLDFNVSDCRKMIDFFKVSIEKHSDWKQFGFQFSATDSYSSIDEFYREVESQGYSLSYTDIDEEYIHRLVDEGKLYLFQIYNKDFSEFSKGKPNMHTMYWKALFDEENLKSVVYKLNGQAEIFYRKKSISDDKKIVHKANEKVKNKNPLNTKDESLFAFDLIKDRRYTLDKFQFHVPITLNFKATGTDYINNDVLSFLRRNPDVNIIGLDRGERHLIYLTLINQRGEILQQYSLNDIINEHKGVSYKTSYKSLLESKEASRAAARENWGTIETIKELKEGYISQVVHKIAQLMVDYNAIVVMEDLNMGFKRGRFKVEKQVYQKLEKMLIDKLNYLVFKDKPANEPGGLYQALQLTNKFESFQKMGKQSGFLFYVPAWNTSKIDPTTGFVNLFYAKYESEEKAHQFFNSFDSIRFNATENYFEFAFDYNNFGERAEGTKTQWTVCTHGARILTFRNPQANNQWDNKEVVLTEQFEDLLGNYQISYGDGACIKAQIVAISSKDFLKSLMDLFRLTLQMRNSITNSEVDYLISPVKNEQGQFYDSRQATDKLPKDADANGAYHIAKKGLMWLMQLHEFEGDDFKKLDFEKTNKGWLSFVQNFK